VGWWSGELESVAFDQQHFTPKQIHAGSQQWHSNMCGHACQESRSRGYGKRRMPRRQWTKDESLKARQA
jgi:hypothetical protein